MHKSLKKYATHLNRLVFCESNNRFAISMVFYGHHDAYIIGPNVATIEQIHYSFVDVKRLSK